MLAHKFPRVRRFTADHLYVRLLEESEILRDLSDSETAIQLLLETPWDSEMTDLEATELSCSFARTIGLGLSWEAKEIDKTMETKKAVDEFASYASLVNSTYWT